MHRMLKARMPLGPHPAHPLEASRLRVRDRLLKSCKHHTVPVHSVGTSLPDEVFLYDLDEDILFALRSFHLCRILIAYQ